MNGNAKDAGSMDVMAETEQEAITKNQKLEFEDIIEHLGSFGHWQRVVFTVICLADLFGCFSIMVTVFSGATPDWSCAAYGGTNASHLKQGQSGNAYANVSADSCAIGNLSCSDFEFDSSFTTIVSKWLLVCDKKYISDMISSIQMAGLLVGAAAFGQMSDTLGRKYSYYIAHTTLTVFGLISSLVPIWQVYAFCRLLVGIGFGGTMVVNCVYPLEFVGRKWRTLTGTIGFWAIGEMILALIAHFLTDWTHLVLVTSATGFLYLLTWPIIPESPRWLVQQGKFEEAKEILDKIAMKNNKPPIDTAVLRRFAKSDQQHDVLLKKYTYLDLFKRWKYTKITIATICTWFTTFLAYYTLSYKLGSFDGNRSLNMFYGGLVDLAAMLLVIFVGNWIGRRIALVGFLGVATACTLSVVCIIATDSASTLNWLVVVFTLIGKGSSLGGTYMCQIYSAELYPTVIRNVGVGIGSISGRIGGILAPQIRFLGTYYELVPFLVPMVLSVLVIPLVFGLKETRNQALEDVYMSQTLCSEEKKDEEKKAEEKKDEENTRL